MDDQSIVRTAKTVEEAIELATLELGVDRDEIEVDVVSRGRAGILGIGAEPAKVRVRLLGETGGSAGIVVPRGTAPAPSTRLNVGDDRLEQEVINKWIASGRVQRSSISWMNTLAKWLLDISLGRAMVLLIGLTLRCVMLGKSAAEAAQLWRVVSLQVLLYHHSIANWTQ